MRLLYSLVSFCFILPIFSEVEAKDQLDTLSLEALYHHTEQQPEEGYRELLDRHKKALNRRDTQAIIAISKYLARYGYLIGNNRISDRYKAEVDSLMRLYPDDSLDVSYHQYLVAYHIAKDDLSKAIGYLEELEPVIREKNDTRAIINFHCHAARAYSKMNDHAVALKHIYRAEKLTEQYEDESLKAAIQVAYSMVYMEQRDFERAYEHLLIANEYFEKTQNYRDLLTNYTNLMGQALNLGKNEEALKFAKKYEELKARYGTQLGEFTQEVNQIWFYIKLEEYEKAEAQAFKTIQLAKEMDRDSSHAIYLLGVAYRGLDRYDLAAERIEKAFNIGKEMGHIGKCTFYSHALYQTYYWEDRFAPALKWYKTHISYRDSVYNEKKVQEIAVYESKLEALEQERKVEQLEGEAEINRQENLILWLSIILGSLLAVTVFYGQRQRSKKEQLRQQGLLLQSKMEREKLEQQLEFKQREVTSQVLHMSRKNSLLQTIKEQISELDLGAQKRSVDRLLHHINRHLDSDEDWDRFLASFKSIHSSFMDKLQGLVDQLSSNDLRLASLMRMNLSNKEIASLLNISNDGVKKARYRLRKKLAVDSDVNLQEYLLQL